jgi:hypothetical protein
MADVIPLYEPEGQQLHMAPNGKAFLASEQPKQAGASLAGPAPHPGHRGGMPVHPDMRPGMGGVAPAAKKAAPQHKMSPDELMALANQMEQQMKAQHAAQLAAGPAVKPVDQGTPPWLQDYMAKQPPTNPYAPIPSPMNMTPEERERYGAQRPAWLTAQR